MEIPSFLVPQWGGGGGGVQIKNAMAQLTLATGIAKILLRLDT